MNHFKKIFNK